MTDKLQFHQILKQEQDGIYDMAGELAQEAQARVSDQDQYDANWVWSYASEAVASKTARMMLNQCIKYGVDIEIFREIFADGEPEVEEPEVEMEE